jgi:hypothetical protein
VSSLSAHTDATVGKIVRPHVFFVIAFRMDLGAGLEHDDLETALGEYLCGLTSRCT